MEKGNRSYDILIILPVSLFFLFINGLKGELEQAFVIFLKS